MTRKEQTIRAIRKLIKTYKKDEIITWCPLCTIWCGTEINKGCGACPNYNKKQDKYCLDMLTMNDDYSFREEMRAEFWETALPKLEKLPDEAFTIKGYNEDNFAFLWELDKKIFKKYNK